MEWVWRGETYAGEPLLPPLLLPLGCCEWHGCAFSLAAHTSLKFTERSHPGGVHVTEEPAGVGAVPSGGAGGAAAHLDRPAPCEEGWCVVATAISLGLVGMLRWH